MTARPRRGSKRPKEQVLPDERIPPHLKRLSAPVAWARGFRGEGVSVAVVDSGIDNREGAARRRLNDHPSREPLILNATWEPEPERYPPTRIKYGGVFSNKGKAMSRTERRDYSFVDEYGHGTKMAGIIAGRPGFDGVMGVAPRAMVYNYKITDEDGLITSGVLEKAAERIRKNQKRTGVRVVLFALDKRVFPRDDDDGSGSKKLKECLKDLSKAGMAVVLAASDHPRSGRDLDAVLSFPGSYGLDNLLVVAAHDGAEVGKEKLTRYTNWGEKTVHLAACGRTVPSVAPTAPVAVFGTSAAAAIVAGAAALVAGAKPKATAAELCEEILKLVRPVPDLAGKTISEGVLDLSRLP